MIPLGIIDTQDVRPAERFALWQSNVATLFDNLESSATVCGDFHGTIRYAAIGQSRVCRLAADAHGVVRTPNRARRDQMGRLKLVVQRRGISHFQQAGRSALLHPGQWGIYDTARPYSFTATQPVDLLTIVLPRDEFLDRRVRLDDVLVRALPAQTGIARLAWQMAATTLQESASLTDAEAAELMRMVVRLVRMATLDFAGIVTPASQRESIRQRVLAHIDANLWDPQLSVADIAQALNCSKRYIHKVFETEQMTVASLILQRRLERCQRDLAEPANATRPITDIAYSWGFNSSAHFSRSFRQAYAVSPREFRSAAAGGSTSR